jgi:hypothetical protein
MRLSMILVVMLLAAGAWSAISGQSRLKFADAHPSAALAQAAK